MLMVTGVLKMMTGVSLESKYYNSIIIFYFLFFLLYNDKIKKEIFFLKLL